MDPNSFKHPAIILARLRSAIEPSLSAAGFRFEGRNKPSRPIYLYLDYASQDQMFRLSWDRRDSDRLLGLIAEVGTDSEGYVTIAKCDLSAVAWLPKKRVTAEVQDRMDLFVRTVNEYLRHMAVTGAEAEA
jgi:class 3 adenylate cyclase